GRLEKRLQGQGIDTANLSGAQQQAKQKIEATQGYLGAEQGTRQKLSQQRRTEVIDGFQTRQNKIGKLGGLASQGLTLSGQAFSAGKSLFAPGMAFEQQMSNVQAQLGLDNNDPRLLALRQQATGMAAKAQSPQDAALAQSALANAGYNPQEVLTAAPAALNLAKTSGSSIDETVKTLAGIQQAFQLPADQAEKIADVMAKASSSYQLSLGDLDKKLRAAAPAALENGMNLEQTAAQLAPQGSSLGDVDGAAQAMVTVRGDNLDGDIQKLFSSWDSIRIDLFDGQNSSLRKLTQTATGWLTTLSQWSTENPALANSLMTVAIAITALIGGLSAIGTFIVPALSAINMLMAGAALLGTVFTAIGGVIAGAFAALSLPIIAVVAAIIGGAALIYKYWEPISAFMGGVAEGFIAAIAPIVEGFSPLLSVFDAAKLSGSIVKLLKTLGLLSTTPPELDEDQIKAAKNDLASSALQDNAAVQNYQPAIAPGAVSTANNRNITNHMTINTTPGMDRQEVEQIIATVNQRNQLDSENAAYSNYHFT
ncbi:MAG: phage tail tape measure protein, partial [Serratia liquefaciens]|nr:phage tail tape measure protein [Serratia liquefaciens]